jgi:hypothetical protein
MHAEHLSTSIKYRRRILAFVDILGFSGLVTKTLNDDALVVKLRDALKIVSDYEPFWRDEERHRMIIKSLEEDIEDEKDRQAAYKKMRDKWGMAFSDTIVLSEEDNQYGLYNIISNLCILSLRLLKIGTFIRGAVTIGPVYHEGSIIFGPALIDAYKLETDFAIYPRIVIADKLVAELESWQHSSPIDPLNIITMCKDLLRRDFDGLYHLDWFSEEGMKFEKYSIPAKERQQILEGFRSIISESLKSNSDLKILIKLRWVARYFNKIVEQDRFEIALIEF